MAGLVPTLGLTNSIHNNSTLFDTDTVGNYGIFYSFSKSDKKDRFRDLDLDWTLFLKPEAQIRQVKGKNSHCSLSTNLIYKRI